MGSFKWKGDNTGEREIAEMSLNIYKISKFKNSLRNFREKERII